MGPALKGTCSILFVRARHVARASDSESRRVVFVMRVGGDEIGVRERRRSLCHQLWPQQQSAWNARMGARALLLASAGGAAAATTAGLGCALLCGGGARRDELATAARVAAAARALLLALLLPLWLWQLHADATAVASDDPRALLCQRLWLTDERCAPSLGPLRPALALLATPLLAHLHHHPAFRVVVRTLVWAYGRVPPPPRVDTRARRKTLHEERATHDASLRPSAGSSPHSRAGAAGRAARAGSHARGQCGAAAPPRGVRRERRVPHHRWPVAGAAAAGAGARAGLAGARGACARAQVCVRARARARTRASPFPPVCERGRSL